MKAEANSRELFLLGLLYRKPMHGYELVRNLEMIHAEVWLELSDKHVYNVLRKFEREGLARSEEHAVAGRPNRKVYSLTRAGRTRLRKMLTSEAYVEKGSDSAFIGVLTIVAHADPLPVAELLAVFGRRRDAIEAQLAADEALGGSEAVEYWLGGTMRSLWDERQREARMQVEWIDGLIAEIGSRGWEAMRMPERELPPGWEDQG